MRPALVKLEQDTTGIEREVSQLKRHVTGRISRNIFYFKCICVAGLLFLSSCSHFFVLVNVIASAAAERMFTVLSASFADLRARPSLCPCFRLALLRSFAVLVSLVCSISTFSVSIATLHWDGATVNHGQLNSQHRGPLHLRVQMTRTWFQSLTGGRLTQPASWFAHNRSAWVTTTHSSFRPPDDLQRCLHKSETTLWRHSEAFSGCTAREAPARTV